MMGSLKKKLLVKKRVLDLNPIGLKVEYLCHILINLEVPRVHFDRLYKANLIKVEI